MSEHKESAEVVIVGGGIAGLVAANFLARAGKSVRVLEKAKRVGGRGISVESEGAVLNLGPHALGRGGRAIQVFQDLGIDLAGSVPAVAGLAACRGQLHRLPTGAGSLAATRALGVRGKAELMKFLAGLAHLRAELWDTVSVNQWLAQRFVADDARAMVQAFCRLATYGNAPGLQSAGAAIRQLQGSVKAGVLYLDGGWQRLVDGLAEAARSGGVTIETSAGVRCVTCEHGKVTGVVTPGGRRYAAESVLLAVEPATAAKLAPESAGLAKYAAGVVPVRTACYSVVLRSLPRQARTFALGIDEPLYFSVHSEAAKLAPTGWAVIHVARYLEPDANDNGDCREALRRWLDLLQPGWRSELVTEHYLPSMIAASALDLAELGGMTGRPRVAVEGVSGLYLAGDWVGEDGLLVDASAASAARAAELMLSRQTAPHRTDRSAAVPAMAVADE